MAAHFGLASARIADFAIDRALLARVPEEVARRHQLLPLCNADGEVYVAVVDPTQLAAFRRAARGTTLSGRPVAAGGVRGSR